MTPEEIRKAIEHNPDGMSRAIIAILDDFIKKNNAPPISAYDNRITELMEERAELRGLVESLNSQIEKLYSIIKAKDATIDGYAQGIKDHLNKAYGKVGVEPEECGDTLFSSPHLARFRCVLPEGHQGQHADRQGIKWT